MFKLYSWGKTGFTNDFGCYNGLLCCMLYTVMHRLTTGIHCEKCVLRWFRHCANVIECSYTYLDSSAYYTPRLYGIAYCSWLQTCTACYCTEYCR